METAICMWKVESVKRNMKQESETWKVENVNQHGKWKVESGKRDMEPDNEIESENCKAKHDQ